MRDSKTVLYPLQLEYVFLKRYIANEDENRVLNSIFVLCGNNNKQLAHYLMFGIVSRWEIFGLAY